MNTNPFGPQGNSSSKNYRQDPTSTGGFTLPPIQPLSGAPRPNSTLTSPAPAAPQQRLPEEATPQAAPKPTPEPTSKLAIELNKFNKLADELSANFQRAEGFDARCQQAFDVANDLFSNAPTWVCFYRSLLGGSGMIHQIFTDQDEFGRFIRSDQYHQIQMMLTALRSRDLPENDPNDPQRMITVRLPKSLHEAMCDEAGRLNISVNRLCISRMLQLLDPKMIPETNSKPRGRKPRNRAKATPETKAAE